MVSCSENILLGKALFYEEDKKALCLFCRIELSFLLIAIFQWKQKPSNWYFRRFFTLPSYVTSNIVLLDQNFFLLQACYILNGGICSAVPSGRMKMLLPSFLSHHRITDSICWLKHSLFSSCFCHMLSWVPSLSF